MFTYNLSTSVIALEDNPGLFHTITKAGVTDVWLAAFTYGYWYYDVERLEFWKRKIEASGIRVHGINVPLGHPGDALGEASGSLPITPPSYWKMACHFDGSSYCGTSLHDPATAQNVDAVRKLGEMGIRKVFLDDDFRLATTPGVIGGCYCDDHKHSFLTEHGYAPNKWDELLADVQTRKHSEIVRDWANFTSDQLTASFRAQQAAFPGLELGIMVMYLGSEKAGIRITDYMDVPLRVGENFFNDEAFCKLKFKTGELFSVLYHRRFVKPELAYSETTAYPANMLSAANMAAKLNVSIFGDVRNIMYMSGLSAFPLEHWDTLIPAMKKT